MATRRESDARVLPSPGTCASTIADGRLRLRLVNDMQSLQAGGEALRDFLAAHAVTERTTFRVDLVYEELAANVIHHAYRGRAASAHAVDVEVALESDSIVIAVEDDGPAFDPTAVPDRPAPESLAAATIGGLGIKFVRTAAAGIEYHRTDGCNRLVVRLART